MEIITVITISAALVTIAWFARDIRKENSKVLKAQSEILAKIEIGQRKGFETLSKSLETQTKILAKIEEKT